MTHTYTSITQCQAILEEFSRDDLVPLTCPWCKVTFTRKKHLIQSYLARGRNNAFCSNSCSNRFQSANHPTTVECANCKHEFNQKNTTQKFCSRSCAAIYNNKHKTHGTRRSKLEEWIENQLAQKYPSLHMLFNEKTAIGSELDIYIPSLRLAVELNGIFHYEPIYGQSKLARTEENDQNKFSSCHAAMISLCVIDVSSQKRFTEKSSNQFLDIICRLIEEGFEARERVELP